MQHNTTHANKYADRNASTTVNLPIPSAEVFYTTHKTDCYYLSKIGQTDKSPANEHTELTAVNQTVKSPRPALWQDPRTRTAAVPESDSYMANPPETVSNTFRDGKKITEDVRHASDDIGGVRA